MSIIVKGKKSSLLLPEYELAPNLPTVKTERLFGLHDFITSKANSYRNAGFTVTTRQVGDSPVWELTARIEGDPSSPDEPGTQENTHELRTDVHQRPFKFSPVLQRNVDTAFGASGISSFALLGMLESYANYIRSSDDPTAAYTTTAADLREAGSPFFPSSSEAAAAFAQRIIDKYLIDLEHALYASVYIHTFNYGTRQDFTLDVSNVNCIFTPAQLIDAENAPTLTAESLVSLGGEWLKAMPEQTVSIGQGVMASYTYKWADSWDTDIYDPAS